MPYEHRNLVMSGSSSMPKNWGWCAQSYFDAHRRKWFRTRKPVMVAHKQMPRSTSRMAVRCRFPTFLSIWGFLIYIYMYIHTHIYVYIYMVYPKCLWVKTHSVDVGFGMPQESGPNEPAERWFFLCPCWSDPPPWKPHPWRGRWKPHGIHEDISWVYNQWWC